MDRLCRFVLLMLSGFDDLLCCFCDSPTFIQLTQNLLAQVSFFPVQRANWEEIILWIQSDLSSRIPISTYSAVHKNRLPRFDYPLAKSFQHSYTLANSTQIQLLRWCQKHRPLQLYTLHTVQILKVWRTASNFRTLKSVKNESRKQAEESAWVQKGSTPSQEAKRPKFWKSHRKSNFQ